MNDNPEAGVSGRASDARLVADMVKRMQAQTLPPGKPKPSTTSFATTGDGGATPIRTADVEQRRQAIAAMAPTISAETGWDHAEKRWAEMERRGEQERQDTQAALRARDEARLAAVKREIERKKKVAAFNEAEQIITMTLEQYGMSRSEAATVRQRMLNAGRIHDSDLCSAICQEVIINRGSNPVEDKPTVDWRPGLKRQK